MDKLIFRFFAPLFFAKKRKKLMKNEKGCHVSILQSTTSSRVPGEMIFLLTS